jgi:hypothetical protein
MHMMHEGPVAEVFQAFGEGTNCVLHAAVCKCTYHTSFIKIFRTDESENILDSPYVPSIFAFYVHFVHAWIIVKEKPPPCMLAYMSWRYGLSSNKCSTRASVPVNACLFYRVKTGI